jgi:hypothetical protein
VIAAGSAELIALGSAELIANLNIQADPIRAWRWHTQAHER